MEQFTVALRCSKIRNKKSVYDAYSMTIPKDFINLNKDTFKTKDKIMLFVPHHTSPFMLLIPEKYFWGNKHTRDQIIKFLKEFEWVI